MQTMDNRYFNILGHATARLLFKRPATSLMDRVIEHARKQDCSMPRSRLSRLMKR